MSILYSDAKKLSPSSVHTCNHEEYIKIINNNRVSKKWKNFSEIIFMRDLEKLYHPFFVVSISSMTGLVNNDIAEEKLEKCIEFLSSKLDFEDYVVTKDIKHENNIYFGVFQVILHTVKMKLGELLAFQKFYKYEMEEELNFVLIKENCSFFVRSIFSISDYNKKECIDMMTEGDNIEHYIVHINNENGIEYKLIEFKIEDKNEKLDECKENNELIEKYGYDSDSENEKIVAKENQSKEDDVMSETDDEEIEEEKSFCADEEIHECDEEFETESLLSEHDEENDKTEIEEEKSLCVDEEKLEHEEEFETDSLVSDDD